MTSHQMPKCTHFMLENCANEPFKLRMTFKLENLKLEDSDSSVIELQLEPGEQVLKRLVRLDYNKPFSMSYSVKPLLWEIIKIKVKWIRPCAVSKCCYKPARCELRRHRQPGSCLRQREHGTPQGQAEQPHGDVPHAPRATQHPQEGSADSAQREGNAGERADDEVLGYSQGP